MRHDAAEVRPVIPGQPVVQKPPGGLPRHPPLVAGEPDDVKQPQPLVDMVGPKEIKQIETSS